ncbi:Protein phosphatase 2C 2 [Kalmusia sp. IMI 367209]|nr:Protein phosphatase 2C 2 [Kalmusia sp. IMI 367209]
MDLDGRFQGNRGLGGGGGRIILLGDGTEITTEAADADMFDNDDEDKDLGLTGKDSTEPPKSQESSTDKKDTTIPEKVSVGTVASEK